MSRQLSNCCVPELDQNQIWKLPNITTGTQSGSTKLVVWDPVQNPLHCLHRSKLLSTNIASYTRGKPAPIQWTASRRKREAVGKQEASCSQHHTGIVRLFFLFAFCFKQKKVKHRLLAQAFPPYRRPQHKLPIWSTSIMQTSKAHIGALPQTDPQLSLDISTLPRTIGKHKRIASDYTHKPPRCRKACQYSGSVQRNNVNIPTDAPWIVRW